MNSIQDSSSESSDAQSTLPSPNLLSSSGLTGGEGRHLPSIPNPSRLTGIMDASIKPLGKQVPPIRGTGGFGPFLQEYSMMAEYNLLHKQKLPGVYVMPSSKSRFIWNGVLFLREGLYAGGALRFGLIIPDSYPDSDSPDFVFEFPIFHPLVDPQTGRVDVKRAFPKWRRNVDHLWQVLMYVRKIFYKIETKAPLNIEAATFYEQDPESFKQHVTDSVQAAKQRLMQPPHSDDPYALRFSPWTQPVHGEARQEMLKSKGCHSGEASASQHDLGLSWMKPGSTRMFVRDDSGSA